MRVSLAPLLMSLALGAGCGGAAYEGSVTVAASVPAPDLVAVGPGVYVIADYDEPIFYANGYYWWLYDGAWYRSPSYTGGWVYAPAPPRAVVSIDRPYRYRRYRPSGYVVRRRPVPAERVQRPVREHRGERPRVREHRR